MAESNRSLSVGFANPALYHCWRLQFKEVERIQNKLEEFLSPHEARETVARVCDVVLEVDEELDRILCDPLVRRLYEYDGLFFTPKHSWGCHRAFDGLHVLKSLSGPIIETFFGVREKECAIRWLMDELEKHIWEAKIRRINWQESRTLSVLPRQVLEQIVRNAREHAGQAAEARPPLTPEEETFFKPFEEQMQPGT